jgi:hypothetical protein
MDIKKQIAFCKSIDAETNEKGQYIYESTNKASKISLPYILLEYEQWLRASKNPVPPTSNCTIPVVSNNEVAVCSQCGKDKYLHPLIADEGLCICNVKQTDC